MIFSLLNLACNMLLLHSRSFAIEPNATVCFTDYELSFFCGEKNYDEAKKTCEDNNSYLVKIDNANMTKAVKSLTDKVHCTYPADIFIGGRETHDSNFPNDGTKRIWKWEDGSKLYLPDEIGYQNWQQDQPNNLGGNEDCVILDKVTMKWKDSICAFKGEEKFYICQKNVTVDIKIEQALYGKKCVASTDSCVPRAEWQRVIPTKVVSYSNSSSLYQTQSSKSSTLHYENATIGDAGEYTCFAWLAHGDVVKNAIKIDIFVNGTPTINDIISFACNTSLLVLWNPSPTSLGFPHQIVTTAVLTRTTLEDNEVTPFKPGLQRTKLLELNMSTKYHIKIVACKDSDECSNKYATHKTVTTRKKVLKVSNVKIQQNNAVNNDTCIVTWDWSGNIATTLQINRYSEPDGSSEEVRLKNTRIYSFDPIYGQAYNVVIQPVAAKNICLVSVVAVGSCVGRRVREENNPWKIGGLNFMIVVPSVAVGVLLLLLIGTVCFWKRTKTPHQQVDNEINPDCPVPTDYGHLHSSSNQDEVDAEGSSDGAVAYSTAADPQSFGDGPIYASVYNPKIRVVVEEEGSNEMNISTEQTASTNKGNLVINPIYDMEEASTSTEKNDVPTEASFNDPSTSANAEEDQELATEDPIYTAVNKVKMKNDKTVRRPTDDDE